MVYIVVAPKIASLLGFYSWINVGVGLNVKAGVNHSNMVHHLIGVFTEAVTRRCFVKKVALEIPQN